MERTSDDDFDYFLVEQKNSIDGEFKQIGKTDKTLGYEVKNLKANTTYWFRVCIVDKYGNKGEYSSVVEETTLPDNLTPQEEPKVVSILPKSAFFKDVIPVRVTATGKNNVTKIKVFTSEDNATWELAGEKTVDNPAQVITETVYIDVKDLKEGPCFVVAVAVDGTGNESPKSVYVEHRIDRTPPDKPKALTIKSNSVEILIEWTRGTESDLAYYNVYKLNKATNEYELVGENIGKLGYIDRKVVFGEEYSYKVKAFDYAGNESEFSEEIIGRLEEDKTKPIIHQVTPTDGKNIGPNTQFYIAVTDDSNLDYITAEYNNNGTWELIGKEDVSGDSVRSLIIWDNKDLPVGNKQVRFQAADSSGNKSEYKTYNYNLVSTEIPKPSLTVSPDNLRMNLSWEAINSDLVAGYNLYKMVDDKETLLWSFNAKSELKYVDHMLNADEEHSYFVETVDTNLNTRRGDIVTKTPVNIDDYPPKAVAGSDIFAIANTETLFDASESTDNVGIVSYHWDFGDGNTALGEIAKHVYDKPGIYEVLLTVKDNADNISTHKIMREILNKDKAGTLKLKVIDSTSGGLIPNAYVYINDGENSKNYRTNNYGEVEIVNAPGEYKISAYVKDYLPKEETKTIYANITTEDSITIDRGDIVVGEIVSKKLSLEETIAAGIDINDPDNNHVFKFEVTLVFEGEKLPPISTITNGNGVIGSGTGGGGSSWGSGWTGSGSWTGGGGGTYYPNIVPNEDPSIPPSIVILKIPAGVTFLKEFFDVSLLVQNMADNQFVIKNNEALLNLPEGLSLVNGFDEKQKIEDIPGGQMRYAKWIVRGDVAGSYEFTADFNGTLIPFDAPINATFKTGDPLIVSDAGEGLEVNIYANPRAIPGKPYYVDYEFANLSDSPRYNVNMTIGDKSNRMMQKITMRNPNTGEMTELGGEPKKYLIEDGDYARSTPVLLYGDSVKINTLNPGEKLTVTYATMFPVDAEFEDYIYNLKDMFYETSGANTIDIKVNLSTKPDYLTKGMNIDTKSCDTNGVDTTGFLVQQTSALSQIGEDTPYYQKYNSNINLEPVAMGSYGAFYENTEDSPSANTSDYGTGGWFSNLDVAIRKNADNTLDVLYTANDYVKFTRKNHKNGEFVGSINDEGYIVVEQDDGAGEYITNIPGYENHVVTTNDDGTLTLTNSSPHTYNFDENGELVSLVDKNNVTTTITNEENQKVITTSNSESKEILTYDDEGRISKIENQDGNVSIYTYNEQGQLVSLSDYNGDTISYEYDISGKITKKTEKDTSIGFEYDAERRITKEIDAMGYETVYEYEETETGELIATITNKNGHTMISINDIYGLVKSRGDVLGNIEKFNYDENNNLITVIDKNNNVIKYDYNNQNQVVAFTNQLGYKQTMEYNENGNEIKVVFPNGSEETSVYDANNNLLKSISKSGLISSYTYDEGGRILTSSIDGDISSYTYSGDNLIKYEDLNGNIETYIYDSNNNLISETNKNGITTYVYNSDSRSIETKDANGLVTKYEYDSIGNLIKTIDSNGSVTYQEYDSKGNIIKTTYPDGSVSTQNYDKNGKLVSSNKNGITVTYEYDLKGRLIKTSDSEGNIISKTYNLNNLLTSDINNDETTSYVYDPMGQLLTTTYANRTTATTSYDALGRTLEEKDVERKVTTYTYDPMGNILTTSLPNGGLITNTYHPTGRLASTTDELGNITKYFYNSMNQVEKVENAKGNSTKYTYDIFDNINSITDSKGNVVKFVYDKKENLLSETDKKGNITKYEYDKKGNITKITDALGNITTMYYNEKNKLQKTINPRGAIEDILIMKKAMLHK